MKRQVSIDEELLIRAFKALWSARNENVAEMDFVEMRSVARQLNVVILQNVPSGKELAKIMYEDVK